MPPVGFEPAIPGRERPQTHAAARPLGSATALTLNIFKLDEAICRKRKEVDTYELK
jgi:hypothetical protein